MTTQHPPASVAGDGRSERAQQLFAAALAASRADHADEAIEAWKLFLAEQPDSAEGHYLLAAEYAQAGRYGDAVLSFAMAVERAPAFAPARFQLGLLWVTLNAPGQALGVLDPLLSLPESEPFHHFGAALVALCRDALPEALAALERGLALPNDNAALVADMRRLQASLQASQEGSPETAETLETKHGLAVSAYSKAKPRG